jgi:hypothetical protein
VEQNSTDTTIRDTYSSDSYAEGSRQISNRVRTEFFGLSVIAITYKPEDCAGLYKFRRILGTGGN